ncbi:Serine/threonine-protein kinase bur1 [Hyaloraphidium curvatum]|nr:Serine/threonine-protein kinase bur1 [Hyaloraphidium curvatum]
MPDAASSYVFSPAGPDVEEDGELTPVEAQEEGELGAVEQVIPKVEFDPRKAGDGVRDTISKKFTGLGAMEDYDTGLKIGEGTFGTVVKAVHRKSGDAVALKLIKFDDMDRNGFPITALREIQLLKMLDHRNILSLREMVLKRDPSGNRRMDQIYMSFDFFPHDLSGLLERHEPGYFGLPVYKLWARQLLEGMYYLHRNLVVHRDVKSANILISDSGLLKVADFGLARPLDTDPNREYTAQVVTRWYRPPELLLGSPKYGPAVDMWGVGCVIAELFSHRPIMAGATELDQYAKVFELCGSLTDDNYPGWQQLPEVEKLKGQGVSFNKPYRPRVLRTKMVEYYHADRTAADLIDKLLLLNPRKRWTANEALDHEWFWSKPLPAEIGSVPRYMPSHEMDIRGGNFAVVRRPAEDRRPTAASEPAGGRRGRAVDSYVPERDGRDRSRERDRHSPSRPWGTVASDGPTKDRPWGTVPVGDSYVPDRDRRRSRSPRRRSRSPRPRSRSPRPRSRSPWRDRSRTPVS